ncbi:MAG: hypothetical protein RL685_994 [Pseudomonadota bacterium]|jgi:hypothetical protein
MTNDERYFLGYRIGQRGAAAVLRIVASASGWGVHWATARSSIAGDVPHDALLDCLERLQVASTGPAVSVGVVCEDEASNERALQGLSASYPQRTESCEALHALAACGVFVARAARPVAVVVADSGVLIGEVDARGLNVALAAVAPATGAAPSSASLGPWGLVAELAGVWPLLTTVAERSASEETAATGVAVAAEFAASSPTFPSTQQGLLRGYSEQRQWLRELLTSADPVALRGATACVQRIVARDLAVFCKTARQTYAGEDLCVTGRLASEAAAARLSLEEQLALGAALLASWSALGTTVHEAQEAQPAPVPCSAEQVTPRAPASLPLESFTQIFTSREQRECFLQQIWGRSSAHLPGLIEPRSLFTGDEFLTALRRAAAQEPGATTSAPGPSMVNVLENGVLQVPRDGLPPYPRQWQGAGAYSWQAAHAALAACERTGAEPWNASLRLTSVHHVCPRLTPLLLSFFEFFSSHCWVNAYYSPARGVRGLSYHADGTDVFVFQVEGEKHWAFDAAPILSSAERNPYLKRVRAGELEPEQQCVLRAGDLLYLPAGTCHAALATTSPSLHLTFAVRRHTALRFRQWWARRCAHVDELNGSVQRYHEELGAMRLDAPLVRSALTPLTVAGAEAALLQAYQQESLRSDREATLQGVLLANVDHA